MKSEAALLRKCVNEVLRPMKARGEPICWVKFHGNRFVDAGTPDLHITYHGRSYWIELKVGSNEPTAIQLARMELWRKAGAVSCVVRSVDDLNEALCDL